MDDRLGGLRSVKAVVFDLDGTLIHLTIDFKKMRREVVEVFERRGVKRGVLTPTETTLKIVEKGVEEMRRMGFSEDEVRETLREVDDIMDRIELEATSKIKPIEGVREAVAELKRLGLKVAILTRGHSTYAEKAMEACGISDLVDVVVTRDDDVEAKPRPEALIVIAKKLGVDLDEVLVVGDHEIDHMCSKSAGARFVGVLTGYSKPEDFESMGCPYVESVHDVVRLIRSAYIGSGSKP